MKTKQDVAYVQVLLARQGVPLPGAYHEITNIERDYIRTSARFPLHEFQSQILMLMFFLNLDFEDPTTGAKRKFQAGDIIEITVIEPVLACHNLLAMDARAGSAFLEKSEYKMDVFAAAFAPLMLIHI